MQDVAERAGVGLATIYRRWPTKQRLVCDAVRFHGHDLLPERTGDARADLEALFRALAAELSGPTGDFIPGFLAAYGRTLRLAEVFHEVVAAAISHVARDLVADVLGPDEPTLDVRADLGPSLLMFRARFSESRSIPTRSDRSSNSSWRPAALRRRNLVSQSASDHPTRTGPGA